MKPYQKTENHEELRKVLHEWTVDAALPSRFQEQVWRRIEHAQPPTAPSIWTIVAHWVGTVLPRPALAISYVVVLMASGATFGWARARQETTHIKEDLSQRYVRVLDPYLAPRE